MDESEQVLVGGCLCGGVRYRINGRLRGVVLCHCSMCRKFSGHVGAYTQAPRTWLGVEGATLAWYESSPGVRRGFCNRCGSSLFWERAGDEHIAVAAGTLDGSTGLSTLAHIYTKSAGDYYTIADDLPKLERE